MNCTGHGAASRIDGFASARTRSWDFNRSKTIHPQARVRFQVRGAARGTCLPYRAGSIASASVTISPNEPATAAAPSPIAAGPYPQAAKMHFTPAPAAAATSL